MKKMKHLSAICLLLSSNLMFSATSLATTTTEVPQASEATTQSDSTETTESTNTASSQQTETAEPNETTEMPLNKEATLDRSTEVSSEKTNSISTRQATDTPKLANPSDAEEIVISDPILKKIILSELRLPENSSLTKENMEKVTSLYFPSSSTSGLSSLSGLEYATNLVDINIVGTNQVTDFSPLENLTKLKYVRLQSSNVTSDNFPDLSKNKEIFLISLSGANVDNRVMDKLVTLTSISEITFETNMNITDISPLKVLPNLTSLRIQFCGVTDFTVIKEFPALTSLAAFGQNTGRNDATTQLNSNKLDYQKETQTLFIPFSIMPNRITNFDGYVPPFTTSNSASNTNLSLNEETITADRLQVTEEGLTISAMSEEAFKGLETISYNARINNPAGSYAQPDNFTFYAISSGTYLHRFNITHGPEVGAPVTVHYLDTDGNPLVESETLIGNLDEPFKSQPAIIKGWHVKEMPINAEGVFKTEAQEIIYTYERSTAAPVTIQYLNENGEEIHEPLMINGWIGDAFDTTASDYQLSIDGFTLNKERLPQNRTGFLSEATQTVIYYYQSISVDPTPEKPIDEEKDEKKTETKEEKTNPVSKPNKEVPTKNTTTKTTTTKGTSNKLPQTGENKTHVGLVIGLGVLGISAVFYLQKRKKNQS